jgi:hypothetical protein
LLDLDDNFLFYSYDGEIFSSKPSILVKILNIFAVNINKTLVKFERFIYNPIKYISKLGYYLGRVFK